MSDSLGYLEIGVASWYGRKFHGRLTSNGETYDMFAMTAAHKSLPIPTIVEVTNLDNGRKAIVRVNDRGPFHDDRLIDVSYSVASLLGFADEGTAPVVVRTLDELNYPDLDVAERESELFYLQVGAFARETGAQRRLDQVRNLISVNGVAEVDVKILTSELEDAILHKVWMGPIGTEEQMDALASLVEAANLGMPLRVDVE
ncbi:MAG: septal ring lytic transglycosylase RlpA family protein [Pseudomonadales bacterium]